MYHEDRVPFRHIMHLLHITLDFKNMHMNNLKYNNNKYYRCSRLRNCHKMLQNKNNMKIFYHRILSQEQYSNRSETLKSHTRCKIKLVSFTHPVMFRSSL